MPQSLRSILGKTNRVRKPSRTASATRHVAVNTVAVTPTQSPRKVSRKPSRRDENEEYQEKLTDVGIARLLTDDLTLRDVVQAMRHMRSKMFSVVPPIGLHSSRIAEVLNYRRTMPPLITPSHLNAILNSPTKVEREVVELVGKGILRKVKVERRAAMGEALIESTDYETMIRNANLSEETQNEFLMFLKQNTTAQTLSRGTLTNAQIDELVRAGFLTSSLQAIPGSTLHIRPEDRTTMTSIHHVSQFASGTVSAVGGPNAIHLAGGGGGGSSSNSRSALALTDLASGALDFRIAVPGHGRHLKLVEGSADWLREALGRTKWGEGPESWLKERFEGGGLYGTRWKEFWGVEWQWVIGEAVGLGIVEAFETGSVGRGIRALGT